MIDGFKIDFVWKDRTESLEGATTFINYPFANKHIFEITDKNMEVERWQFVPDKKEGVVVLPHIWENIETLMVTIKY